MNSCRPRNLSCHSRGGYGLTRATLPMIAGNDLLNGELIPTLHHGHILGCINKLPGVIWPRLLFSDTLESIDVTGSNFGHGCSLCAPCRILLSTRRVEQAKAVTLAIHCEKRKTTEGMFGQGYESITCFGTVVGKCVVSFVRGAT